MDKKFRVGGKEDEMLLLLPAYMKNIRRLVIILAVLLLYISMYLIHNAYGGALCVIKSADDSKAGDNGQQEASRLLYKVNDGNLFADLYANNTTQVQSQRTEESSRDYNTHVDGVNIDLDDIFISVKTTKIYHRTRLRLIIETWFQLARDQIWFFTDHDDDNDDDEIYQNLTNNHMVMTKCPSGHDRKSLCCKMNKEFDFFLSTAKKFWCHFDDDNYVNIPTLVKLLNEYHAYHDWYLGKPSISSPIETYLNEAITSLERGRKNGNKNIRNAKEKEKVKFLFATGGAGFCISRALALKMMPLASNGKFEAIGNKIRFPDDVTLGFIIEHLLKVPLTVVNPFHSHLERMENIDAESFRDQISFSYAHIKDDWNVVNVDGFDSERDPYRFYSLHCYLFPHFDVCKSRHRRR